MKKNSNLALKVNLKGVLPSCVLASLLPFLWTETCVEVGTQRCGSGGDTGSCLWHTGLMFYGFIKLPFSGDCFTHCSKR